MTVPSAGCRVPRAVLSLPAVALAKAGARCWVLGAMCCAAAPASAQVAVHGETVHTMAGAAIKDGVVLVGKDGKIERVGPAASVRVPTGYRVLRAKVVTPGLVDAHSVVGLAGYLNQPHDQMQLETSSAIQPELRAIDGYNAREMLVEWLRIHGVTTVHTGHAPGALVPGQTMVVKTRGDEVEQSVIVPLASVAATLGTSGLAGQGKSPGNRSKAVAMLRAELIKAKDYVAKLAGPEDKRPARDLKLEALGKVVSKDAAAAGERQSRQRHPDRASDREGVRHPDHPRRSRRSLPGRRPDQGRQRAGDPARDDVARRRRRGEHEHGDRVDAAEGGHPGRAAERVRNLRAQDARRAV